MSDHDREKWDAKYAAIPSPLIAPLDPWLEQQLVGCLPGRALDVACGLGSLAMGLAQRGWSVTAVDISSTGLVHARQSAVRQNVSVDWVCADLDVYVPPESTFDLITVFRFLQRGDLPDRLSRALKPGGRLLHMTFVESLTGDSAKVDRPHNPAFLLQTGELPRLYPDLTLQHYSEHVVDQAKFAKFAGVRDEHAADLARSCHF